MRLVRHTSVDHRGRLLGRESVLCAAHVAAPLFFVTDLVARVFNMKLDALLTDLWATGIFGHVLARVHTVRVPLDYL